MGYDAVKESVMKGKARLVLCASDLSEGNTMRAKRFCEGLADCVGITATQEELLAICKKPTGIFAVTDPELAKLCRKSIAAKTAAEPAAIIKEERE
ncbi:MAG: hypothetical protein RR825_05560 [Ruthenibacterium sp.]